MSHPDPIRPAPDGFLHRLILWDCPYSILEYVLNPEVSFVWLHRHMPQSTVAWYGSEVPLVPGGEAHRLEARNLEHDVAMTTEEFLALLPEFSALEHHDAGGPGLDLFQMGRKVPDTLRFRPEDEDMNRVLVRNGLFLKFVLPHARETAC